MSKYTSASTPTMDGKMPHILCTKDDIGEIVLLPGDPGRVAMFRDMLDDFKIVSQNREYTVGTGFYEGVKITVCSTGIGASNPEKWQNLIDDSKEIGNIDETFEAAELLYTPAE